VVATLVAGGAGFIGSNLCERLVSEGHSVICLDNLVTGRRENIAHLLDGPKFEFHEADLVHSDLAAARHVDNIMHLASPASPSAYLQTPIETLRVNSEGTLRLLDLAAESGARFLYASTSEIYGDPLEHPQREESFGKLSSTGERGVYHEGKRFGEALTMAYHREGKADARIVRIFNTYGPRSDPEDGRIVPNFVWRALKNEPLPVYGDGSQTRSLCYVDDLVEGLVRALESPRARGEVINLGNPDEHTVLDYAEIVRRLTGSDSRIEFVPLPSPEEPKRRRPDITKARELLGWEPVVGLDDGLGRTIDYFRSVLEGSKVKAPSGV
jgi:nucleoside-diphosphate-sugar epimerase